MSMLDCLNDFRRENGSCSVSKKTVYGPSNHPTDGQTDTNWCRDARTHLKKEGSPYVRNQLFFWLTRSDLWHVYGIGNGVANWFLITPCVRSQNPFSIVIDLINITIIMIYEKNVIATWILLWYIRRCILDLPHALMKMRHLKGQSCGPNYLEWK